AQESRRAKAARVAPVPVPVQIAKDNGARAPSPARAGEAPAPHVEPPVPHVEIVAPPQQPIESKELVDARVALQRFRQRLASNRDARAQAIANEAKQMDARLLAQPDAATIQSVNAFVASKQRELNQPLAPPSKPDLILAYRTLARGEIDKSETLLTLMIDNQPSAEALLLRGCARYTAAMLSRKPDLTPATSDFKTALKMNRSLRLDKSAFSPKLVAYFDELRSK